MKNSAKNMISITISNPHSWERTSLVSFKFQNTLALSGLQIYDSENCEITSQMDPEVDGYRQVRFVAELIPANGCREYHIKGQDRTADLHLPDEGLLDGNEFYLENDSLRIIVEMNGTLTIMDKDEHVDDPNEEKLIIMGEELGNGSIWAGDSFHYYPKLHQFAVDSTLLTMENVKYDLLEASDFGGKIQVQANLVDKDGTPYPLTTFIELEKGEKPVIRIRSLLPAALTAQAVSVIYPTPLKCDVIAHDNVLSLWDTKQQHGLGIFTLDGKYTSQHNPDGALIIHLPTGSSEYCVGLVPIKEFDASSTDPQNNDLFRLAAEYYTPLNWKIEN